MRFTLRGANRQTGKERDIVVEAASLEDARRRIFAAGYLVIESDAYNTPIGSNSESLPRQVPTSKLRSVGSDRVIESTAINPPRSSKPSRFIEFATLIVLSVAIGGPFVGYASLGFIGIFLGLVVGILLALGIGVCIVATREKGYAAPLVSIAIFALIALCLKVGIPFANRWNDFWTFKPIRTQSADASPQVSKEESEKFLQSLGWGTVTEADRVIRAAGEDPDKISYEKRRSLQQSIEQMDQALRKNEHP